MTNTNGKKRCNKCGEWLPRTSEYFYRDSSTNDGLKARCKKCYEQVKKAWKPSLNVGGAFGKCRKCGATIRNSTSGYCRPCYQEHRRDVKRAKRMRRDDRDYLKEMYPEEEIIGNSTMSCKPMGYAISEPGIL